MCQIRFLDLGKFRKNGPKTGIFERESVNRRAVNLASTPNGHFAKVANTFKPVESNGISRASAFAENRELTSKRRSNAITPRAQTGKVTAKPA